MGAQAAQEKELAALLGETVEAARAREGQCFDRLAGSGGDAPVLFGAGSFGRRVLAVLRGAGLSPAVFCDSDSNKWGSVVDGIPVLSPEDAAKRFGAGAPFVLTIWNREAHSNFPAIKKKLAALGCRTVLPFAPLAWKYPALLPSFYLDLPHRLLERAAEVASAFGLFEDDCSRGHYLAQLRLRLLADFEDMPEPSHGDEYFPDGIMGLSDSEVFVDGGAFDGDTVRAFIGRSGGKFSRIIAFEPDPANFARLEACVAQMPQRLSGRIAAHRLALCDKKRELPFFASAAENACACSAGKSGALAQGEPLDAMLGGLRPTFIKLDVEGGERAALDGARGCIARWKPKLAVCLYHLPADLWELPLYVRSLCGDYRFFLRSHGENGFDTVLYAMPR